MHGLKARRRQRTQIDRILRMLYTPAHDSRDSTVFWVACSVRAWDFTDHILPTFITHQPPMLNRIFLVLRFPEFDSIFIDPNNELGNFHRFFQSLCNFIVFWLICMSIVWSINGFLIDWVLIIRYFAIRLYLYQFHHRIRYFSWILFDFYVISMFLGVIC